MNEIAPLPRPHRITSAAEGLPRWRWTVKEVERMTELGLFEEADRLELLGGELVVTAAKSRCHEVVRNDVSYFIARAVPPNVFVTFEPQFNLADDTYLMPDILLSPREILVPDLKGPEALLVIEVSETSEYYDLGRKAMAYATFGIPEYWVILAPQLKTVVHRDPSPNGYGSILDHGADLPLSPLLIPDLVVRLDRLVR